MRAAAFVAALLLLLLAAPAQAVETATFGLAPTTGTQARVTVAAGGRAETTLRVWNKTAQPLDVKLTAEGVRVDGSEVTFDDVAVDREWVTLPRVRFTLQPNATDSIRVVVHPPDDAIDNEEDPGHLLITAEATPPEAGPAAVIQRLALVTYLDVSASEGESTSRNWIVAAVASALLVIAAAATTARTMAARRSGDA